MMFVFIVGVDKAENSDELSPGAHSLCCFKRNPFGGEVAIEQSALIAYDGRRRIVYYERYPIGIPGECPLVRVCIRYIQFYVQGWQFSVSFTTASSMSDEDTFISF